MSVPFEQAIEELSTIFGGFDKEIIETVLRQNKGHMEKTIDALLEMNGEQPINENTDQDQNLAQIEQDEMFARMMQNQLFINELRNDEDFSGFFNNNNSVENKRNNNSNSNNNNNNNNRGLTPKEELEQFQREKALRQQRQQQYDEVEEPSAFSLFEEDFQDIKEKFNQLGEAAKTKFRELTEMFNKKEETKYEPSKEDSDEENEVIVYDRYNNNNINNRRSHTGINSNYSLNNSDGGEEEEFDSFILESDRNRTGSRLRSTAAINSYSDKKKD
ncbi:hypothetical protein ACTFIZ_006701 [Dictyostelium cf. discoideum]